MKSSIVIAAKPADEHAKAIELALAELGEQVLRIDSQSHEFVEQKSTFLPRSKPKALGRSVQRTYQAKAAWLWRPLPAPWELATGNPSQRIRDIECEYQRTTLLQSIEDESTFVLNRCLPALRLESKYHAIKAAQQVGLNTPATIITADAQALSEFFDKMNGQVVYKSHRQHQITTSRFIATTIISREDLCGLASTSLMPGIYQELLDIAFEVRVLVMGHHTLAAKIANNSRFVDIRIMLGSINKVTPFIVPPEIKDSCIRLIAGNDLLTGSIDLAITKDGEYYCLDVNPFGKFLWMEKYCNSLPVLDQFTRFLSSADPSFEGVRTSECKRLTLSQFVC